MSKDGKAMLGAIQQMRDLFQQFHLVLSSADALMKENGWDAYSNLVSQNVSQAISLPRQWMPDYLFRFYTSSAHSRGLTFISIILDDDQMKEFNGKLTEPLITAGFFMLKTGSKPTDSIEYHWAKFFGYYGDMKQDKDVRAIMEPSKNYLQELNDPKNQKLYPFETYRMFGFPLVYLKDTKDLKEKVIDTLLMKCVKA